MQDIQDCLTLAIELVFIIFFMLIANDLLNQAKHIGGYYIPSNWQPPETIPLTDTQFDLPTPLDIAALSPLPKFTSSDVILSAINSTSLSDIDLPDPWTLPVDELLMPFLRNPNLPERILLLPPARQHQQKIAELKLYKLRSHSVVRVEDVHVPVPPRLKRYQLHGFSVVRLDDLEAAIG